MLPHDCLKTVGRWRQILIAFGSERVEDGSDFRLQDDYGTAQEERIF
jgi:hypothetical protein